MSFSQSDAARTIENVTAAMRTQPWGVTEDQGRFLFEFVLREQPEKILELGSGIGTSACYMSAALALLGRGTVTSIDCNPDLPEWVARTFDKVDPAFRAHHKLIISETSYNDELMQVISAQTDDGVCRPLYDFCFIDGAHTWEVDGCAFFLCEKLLKPGKWILFDDLTWTIAGSVEAQKHLVDRKAIPLELQQTPQVMKIFELLVAQHHGFEQHIRNGDWGWARKRRLSGPELPNLVVEIAQSSNSFRSRLRRLIKGRR